MPYQILESDENPVWVPDGPMRVTDPVVVPFDHPDIATGVDLGFVGSATVYPVSVLLNVTEVFDGDPYLRPIGTDGIIINVAGYNVDWPASKLGPYSMPVGSPVDIPSQDPITTIRFKLNSGTPTQGSVTVRVLYCDLSTL